MTSAASTPTLDPAPPRPAAPTNARALFELLSSMRFAIALLTIICIASVIGTVVKQHEPWGNYVNQFGPFWAEVFRKVRLDAVYSAPWFLAILGFLVLSTSLCIARNLPKILTDWKSWKLDIRERSLDAFHHRASGTLPMGRDEALRHVDAVLTRGGWRARAETRPEGTMIAARTGRVNRLGYLAAHGAIVLICLGGLLDGDLIVRAQMALRGVTPFVGDGSVSQVGPQHILPATNPTFRGNLPVVEGDRSDTAMLSLGDGVVLQKLPFSVELKKFIVEYYDTGMPKLFASDVVIHDADGKTLTGRIKVNEPLIHDGIAIYQSSFDDGGSHLTVRALPLAAGQPATVLQGIVGNRQALPRAAGASAPLAVEWTSLRVINVENLSDPSANGADVRKVDLKRELDKHLGSAAKGGKTTNLRNVGPSIGYKLRDAAGQAREFHTYMLPVNLEGQPLFLAGVREDVAEPFRYLRMPPDDQGRIDGFWRLAQALRDPAAKAEAVERYVRNSAPSERPEIAAQLKVTTARALGLFAGDEKVKPPAGEREIPAGGLPALSRFIDTTVPEPERQRIADVLLRIVNGTLFELANLAREREGLKPMPQDDATRIFMTQAVLALSDLQFYPAPTLLMPTDFRQVQASVFQVARAPGQKWVYLGAVLLILGVFLMLYVRERRLWVWIADDEASGGTRLKAALSTTRRTLDTDTDFEKLRADLLRTPDRPA